MIVITKIEACRVDRDDWYQHHMMDRPMFCELIGRDPSAPVEPSKVDIEHIQGRRFRNSNGEEVCLGATQEVQNILGMPLDALESMHKSLYDAEKAYHDKCAELRKQKFDSPFFSHIKIWP